MFGSIGDQVAGAEWPFSRCSRNEYHTTRFRCAAEHHGIDAVGVAYCNSEFPNTVAVKAFDPLYDHAINGLASKFARLANGELTT